MSLNIIPVLCNEKNMANYAYILIKDTTIAIVDAAEATPIINKLEELNLTPQYILTTHHHFDHVEGNKKIKQKYNAQIIAPKSEFTLIEGADIPADENTPLILGKLHFSVIDAPGHTKGHVLYHLPDEQKIFTGDVLFNLCIGGLFEGTPAEMFQSLQKIKKLPDNTEIFPGHEYTRACIPHTQHLSPEFNIYIQKMLSRENGNNAPATLHEEKMFNPYLQAQTISDFIG